MAGDASASRVSRTPLQREFWALIALFLVPAIPMLFLGYGSDNDTYQELDAGDLTWTRGIAHTSRHPGYWVHEALIHFLGKLGGPFLVNLVTLGVALLIMWRVWTLATRLEMSWRFPICLCIAWNPWFLIAATSAIDYLWAILFLLLAVEAFIDDRPTLAGLWGALAIGIRLGSVFPMAGAFTLNAFGRRASPGMLRQLIIAGAVASIVGLFFYIPSWLIFNRNLSFLTGHIGNEALWTLKMHLGRAFYKPLYLVGLVADVCVLVLLALNYGKQASRIDPRGIVPASVGAVLGNLALFVKYPIEYSYLLPALPFVMLFVGMYIQRASALQPWALVAATVCFWFFSLPLATPNVPNGATDATLGLSWEKGVLLQDVKMRKVLMGCDSLACYESKLSGYNYSERAPL